MMVTWGAERTGWTWWRGQDLPPLLPSIPGADAALHPRAHLTTMTIVTIYEEVASWARIRGQSRKPRPNFAR